MAKFIQRRKHATGEERGFKGIGLGPVEFEPVKWFELERCKAQREHAQRKRSRWKYSQRQHPQRIAVVGNRDQPEPERDEQPLSVH